MTWAILPAAGRGTRFGGELPKQYLEVDGEPLIAHALRALLAHPAGAGAVVATAMSAMVVSPVSPERCETTAA
jgi:2-C-methyl-D-erythritol 4-phosphate cytidylyltransferase